MIIQGAGRTDAVHERADVVVVGTGSGGATLAVYLAERGWDRSPVTAFAAMLAGIANDLRRGVEAHRLCVQERRAIDVRIMAFHPA